jgi:hypothetical protein
MGFTSSFRKVTLSIDSCYSLGILVTVCQEGPHTVDVDMSSLPQNPYLSTAHCILLREQNALGQPLT